MLIHIAIAIILGAVAGFVLAKVYDRVDMGVVWNLIIGALGGLVVATYLGAFGFDEHNSIVWSVFFSLVGGLIGVLTIGLCRPGLKVFWEVLTGKSNGEVERR